MKTFVVMVAGEQLRFSGDCTTGSPGSPFSFRVVRNREVPQSGFDVVAEFDGKCVQGCWEEERPHSNSQIQDYFRHATPK